MGPSLWLADVAADAFRGEDVHVVVHDGWETRSANTTAVDHQGVMVHDTGSAAGSSYTGVVDWIKRNSPIAPLANIATCPAGWSGRRPRIDIIAAGRTNHAGKPDDTWDPFDAWLASLGNRHMIGVEHFWTPTVSWPDSYVDLIGHLDAAMLAHMGQPTSKVVGHNEYATGRKQDPRLLDMDDYRRTVAAHMEDDVTPEDIERIKDAILGAKWRDYITGDSWTLAAGVFAARSSAFRAERDAAIARRIAEQQATSGRTVTQADIDAIADAVADEQATRMAKQ